MKADQNVEILEIIPQKYALEFYLHRELFLTGAIEIFSNPADEDVKELGSCSPE